MGVADVFRDEWPRLVATLVRDVGDLTIAEDAAQEALIRIWEQRERWHEGSARALAFRIGRNLALAVLHELTAIHNQPAPGCPDAGIALARLVPAIEVAGR